MSRKASEILELLRSLAFFCCFRRFYEIVLADVFLKNTEPYFIVHNSITSFYPIKQAHSNKIRITSLFWLGYSIFCTQLSNLHSVWQ